MVKNCTKIYLRQGSAPNPAAGAYSASYRPPGRPPPRPPPRPRPFVPRLTIPLPLEKKILRAPIAGNKRSSIWGFPSIYALLHRTTKSDVVTHTGSGLVLVGPKGAEPQRSPILRVLFLYSFNAERPRSTCGVNMCFLGSVTPSISRAEPQRSLHFGVHLYLCLRASTKNDVPNSAS